MITYTDQYLDRFQNKDYINNTVNIVELQKMITFTNQYTHKC